MNIKLIKTSGVNMLFLDRLSGGEVGRGEMIDRPEVGKCFTFGEYTTTVVINIIDEFIFETDYAKYRIEILD